MRYESDLRAINRLVFICALFLGIIAIAYAIVELNFFNSDSSQSRIGFRWGNRNTILIILLVVFTTLLVKSGNRIFPFNGPVSIILVGFWYEWLFLTFTVGWVGFLGFVGLGLAIAIAVLLALSYVIHLFLEKLRENSGDFREK